MTVEEGNILIAEFMCGWRLGELFEWPNGGKGYANVPDFKYHSSWDWLMPVVEKIGKLSPYTISQDYIRISDAGITYKRHPTIEAVWNGVVLYIQWYNTQTK